MELYLVLWADNDKMSWVMEYVENRKTLLSVTEPQKNPPITCSPEPLPTILPTTCVVIIGWGPRGVALNIKYTIQIIPRVQIEAARTGIYSQIRNPHTEGIQNLLMLEIVKFEDLDLFMIDDSEGKREN